MPQALRIGRSPRRWTAPQRRSKRCCATACATAAPDGQPWTNVVKRERVRNTVWLTADVHCCAAHYYDSKSAAFSEVNIDGHSDELSVDLRGVGGASVFSRRWRHAAAECCSG